MRSYTVLCIIVTIVVVSTTDYCSPDICSYGKHIACGHNGQFSSSCPPDAQLVTLSQPLKQLLVDGHNAKRNLVAGGSVARHSPACRMATMSWNEELAKLAALNVRQCKMSHDKCRNTKTYEFSGQNLAWRTYYDDPDHEEQLNSAIDSWFSENEKSDQSYIDSYRMGPMIGHFTVMSADRNIQLGCAAATYSERGQPYKGYLIACNYATTNMMDNPIYEKCSQAATGCTTGTNSKYPNLCSPNEVYDVNKWSW